MDEIRSTVRKLKFQEMRIANSLGLLVIKFNRLEHSIGEILTSFVKAESFDDFSDNISIVTAALSFSQKLDLLSAFYLKRYKDHKPQCEYFSSIIRRISNVEQKRNTYIHSNWHFGTIGETELKRYKDKIRGRKGLKKDSVIAKRAEILEVCKEIQDINLGLIEIYRSCSKKEIIPQETIDQLNNLQQGSS